MKHPLSVMIWGSMSRKGVGMIQVLEGNINACRYIKEVLEPKMLPSARDLFGASSDYIFQQDGAPCHTARVCTRWFQQHNVQLLTWPRNSLDLNPISGDAEATGQQDQPYAAIISSWFRVITSAELGKLVDSMPRRCMAVMKVRGYQTRYWTLLST